MTTDRPAADAPPADPRAAELLQFWLEAGPKRWFVKDDAFDAAFGERFMAPHMAAARRELDDWSANPSSALALVILLDQFPRNAFRGTAHMYATDPLARHVADRLLAAGFDLAVDPALRRFCYLPYMHSESLADHDRSVELNAPLEPESVRYALHHRDIVRRFGRFPHRNRLLGRETTAEERAFLDSGGFGG